MTKAHMKKLVLIDVTKHQHQKTIFQCGMTLSAWHSLLVVSSIPRVLQTPFLYRFTVSPQALSTHFPESQRIQGRCFQQHSQPARRPCQCRPFTVQPLKLGVKGNFYDIATGYVAQIPVIKSCESTRPRFSVDWKLNMKNIRTIPYHK